MGFLSDVLIYLAVAVIAVPLSKKAGLGSVLGYLIAGVIIGPSVLRLVTDVDAILHFSELGVVFLLFIIGLEIQPSRLWLLRRNVFGLGGAQVLVSAVLLSAAAVAVGLQPLHAIVTGLALSLSSTAFVMQLLAERAETAKRYGRSAFAVLLFQDMAVIPMLALLPLLAASGDMTLQWQPVALAAGALLALVVGGRWILRPVLRVVAGADIHELLTAVALLVVIGAAALMYQVGLSMGLGAFIAGMLLADSEYRHQLESDIEPFKGLLLGLFFIAVGMSVNLHLFVAQTAEIAAVVAALMVLKGCVLLLISQPFDLRFDERVRLGVILSQGGEFAFVLLTAAVSVAVLPAEIAEFLIVVVSISMALTPLLMIITDHWLKQHAAQAESQRPFDELSEHNNEVIIASFGRFGQIIGRILTSKGIPFTALESNPEQVDVVRRFGGQVYFGDARRIDLLRAAGAEHARYLILAIEDIEASVETARLARQYFPHLKILARARNRLHAHRLMNLGIVNPVRDTLHSSLVVCRDLLHELGYSEEDARHITETFLAHDEQFLRQQSAFHRDEKKLIQTAHESAEELASLLRRDRETARREAASRDGRQETS